MRDLDALGVTCRSVVRRLMRFMRLVPINRTLNTSKKHPQHKIYPYLLRGLTIDRPNQVWCVDITYIPMRRGFLYLVAIMDWFSRKVLSWRLPNSIEADFCPLGRLLCNRLPTVVKALKEAIAKYGKPAIMNSPSHACKHALPGSAWTVKVAGSTT
ncbi:MAG: putative transposase [Paracoccaceae bacterium]|jgi:putative transposase